MNLVGKSKKEPIKVEGVIKDKIPEGSALSMQQLKEKVEIQEKEIQYLQNMVVGSLEFIDRVQSDCNTFRQNMKQVFANSPMTPKPPQQIQEQFQRKGPRKG